MVLVFAVIDLHPMVRS